MRLAIFTFIFAVLLPITAHAQTENRYDPYGAQGDAGVDMRCFSGRYVVGFTGATGENIDRIQLLCAKLGSDGKALPSDYKSILIGGLGGAPATANCGGYITGLSVYLNRAKKQVRFLNACGGFGQTTREDTSPIPGTNTIWFRAYECPAGMAVTGLTLRYGQHINAVGVICGTIVVPPAPPPPPPAKPVRPAPVVPPRDMKMPSFAGRWLVTKRSGGTFTLELLDGDANDITGTFTSGDGKFNGTLTGMVGNRGRNFAFTYRITATGKTGSGKMLYRGFDPKGFIGPVKTDDAPPVQDVWGGARQ